MHRERLTDVSDRDPGGLAAPDRERIASQAQLNRIAERRDAHHPHTGPGQDTHLHQATGDGALARDLYHGAFGTDGQHVQREDAFHKRMIIVFI